MRAYGDFGEPMSHMHAAAITNKVGLKSGSQIEHMDYQTKIEGGSPVPPWMRYYASRTDELFLEEFEAFIDAECSIPGADVIDGFDPDSDADVKFFQERRFCCTSSSGDKPGRLPSAGTPWTPTETSIVKDCFLQNNSGMIWRVLFDMLDGTGTERLATGDATSTDFDGIDGGFDTARNPIDDVLVDVAINYVGKYVVDPTPAGWPEVPPDEDPSDRGGRQAKFIDIVDGMVCRGHMTEKQSTDLLVDAMGYAYNFANAPTSCD